MMSQKTTLALLLLLSSLVLSAQELVPYLCSNGQYGISDDKGNLVVPCEYDEIVFKERDSIFSVKKNNKYGIMGYPSCKIIMPASFETSHFYIGNINREEVINGKTLRLSNLQSVEVNDYVFVFDAKDEGKTPFYALKNNSYKTNKYGKHYLNSRIKYEHGLWRFKQKDGLINFYHKDGYLLLKKDVINGMVISKDRLSIEGGNGKLALMNLKGKALTPYIYENIETLSTGQYIVNSFKGYPIPKWVNKVKTGVLSKEGKLIIDTAYVSIETIHEKWYIVSKKQKENTWGYDYGVINTKGNIVFPVKYNKLTVASENHIILKTKDGKALQLIDVNFPKKVVLEAKDIRFLKDKQVYLITNEDKTTTVLGLDLEEIYTGAFIDLRKGPEENGYLINTGKRRFVFTKKGKKDIVFEGINRAYSRAYPNGLHYVAIVKSDTLHGLLDENYRVIFKPIYANITVQHHDVSQLYILTKKTKNSLYEIHDSTGQQLDIPPIADPYFLRKDVPFMRKNINREKKLLYRDGRIKEVLDVEVFYPIQSNNGKYLYGTKSKSSKRYYVLNEELYNIIPEGYWIPKQYFKREQLKTGLICVYNDFNCGVIDAEGNWVIRASYNAYEVHDAQTIVQRTPTGEGATLFIKKGNQWIMGTKYSELRPVRTRNLYRIKKKKGEKGYLVGLIDSIGNMILPMAYDFLSVGEKYTVGVKENKLDTSHISYIFDESFQLLFETPFKVDMEEKDNYLIIWNYKTKLGGIINFKNEQIIAPKYNSIQYFPKSKHIKYATGNRQNKDYKNYIADLNGKVIYTSPSFYTRYVTIDGTPQLLITDNKKMKIFDKNNKIIATHNLLFKRKAPGWAHFITCEKLDTKQTVYVNVLTGKAMMD